MKGFYFTTSKCQLAALLALYLLKLKIMQTGLFQCYVAWCLGSTPQGFPNIMIERRFFFHPFTLVGGIICIYSASYTFWLWNETRVPTCKNISEGRILRGQVHCCCLSYQGAPIVMVWALGHWGIQDGPLRLPAVPPASLDRWIIDLIDQRFSSQWPPLISNCHHFCYEHCRTSNVMAIAVEWEMVLLSPAPVLFTLPIWLWVICCCELR